VTTGARPGLWFRVTAAGAAAATALVVSSGASGLERVHNVLALVALAFLTALFLCARFAYPRLAAPAGAALALMVAEIGLGGVAWGTGDGAWVHAAHVAIAGAALGAALVAAAAALRGERVPSGSPADYVTLTKPRIMTLLLLTGAGGMFVGARGTPSATGLAVMLLGLALACGGASALNHVLDRDIDSHMRRTDRRPVAAGRVPAARALEFGLALSALSFALLASASNVLTALLALAGNLFYVVVYTRWLKRSTPLNIVIGGAAGAIPPLVGFAAATNSITVSALALFLVVFFWTPPHFWALALLIKRDYAAARVPMLPVVRGDDETVRQILLYSLVLVPVTLLPVALRTLGAFYLGSALVLGATLVALAWRLRRDPAPSRARSLFHYSLAYLALLFVAMSVDPLLHVGVA
jgi:heme o synthase